MQNGMIVAGKDFNDALELANVLERMAGQGHIVYVHDSKGNQFNRAEMREEKLSDGSKVYNMYLR